jgi:hypothetical protein
LALHGALSFICEMLLIYTSNFLYFCCLKNRNILESLTKEIIVEFIRKNEIELSSTHTKLCLPVINRIFKKMSAGIKFSSIKVESNLICDGHHRYIASILANFPLERIPGIVTSATAAVHWASVAFEDEDWDTPAKINMLNEQDADYNNIPIEKIAELPK